MKKIGKTTVSAIAAALMLSAVLTACGKNNNNASPTAAATKAAETKPTSEEQQVSPTNEADNVIPAVNKYPEVQKTSLYGGYTQDMSIIERSLLSTGNTERLQNVLYKATSGEPITIAFIGGSITEGYKVDKTSCFATLFSEWMAGNFETEVNCVNAGISGTPSVLGNLRAERDVLSSDPDLVVVEFAVNDGNEDAFKNSYESLINKLLAYKTEPAVLLLFTITRDGHTCQSWQSKIGEFYDLPMVSVPDSIWKEVKDGHISYDDYSSDETHPNRQGHKWIRELLSYCIETVYNMDFEKEHYEIPEDAYYKKYYKDMVLYDNTSLATESLGSWQASKTMNSFPNGWAYVPGGDNEPLSFKADCRAMIILFHEMPKNDEEFGAAEVYMDGKKLQTINAVTKSGWNNPTYCVVFEAVDSEEHEFNIKAAEGFEDKKFEILGIAYTK